MSEEARYYGCVSISKPDIVSAIGSKFESDEDCRCGYCSGDDEDADCCESLQKLVDKIDDDYMDRLARKLGEFLVGDGGYWDFICTYVMHDIENGKLKK
jgi:hypothetical protein